VKLEVVQKKPQGKWRAQGDDFRTFLDQFVVAFSLAACVTCGGTRLYTL
jgi:hypothetical protein